MGDEIDVEIRYVVDSTIKLAHAVENLAVDLERWGRPTLRMPKLTGSRFPPWGQDSQDPLGSACGGRIDFCANLDKFILFLKMICAGLNRA